LAFRFLVERPIIFEGEASRAEQGYVASGQRLGERSPWDRAWLFHADPVFDYPFADADN